MTGLKVGNIELEVIGFKTCGLVGLERVRDAALSLRTAEERYQASMQDAEVILLFSEKEDKFADGKLIEGYKRLRDKKS